MLSTQLLHREWTAFRRPGRLIALAVAALIVIALGLVFTSTVDCGDPCPVAPTAADGSIVNDQFWFHHRDLGPNGVITVRMTSMTGTITYPPPNHDQIVSGLVPWAKAGIIIKDGVRQGSPYAALMMTGHHGVRMQADYRQDIAGSSGGPSPGSPRWLRLTRSGDTITGAESADGRSWQTVGTVRLAGLPETVQAGLFAASPGDLTLREVGLGGAIEEVRFTQATGVFDHVEVTGAARSEYGAGASGGKWRSESVGEMNHTDWEKYHTASGAVEKDGVITVSGTGDIGPSEGGMTVTTPLFGLVIALIIVLVVAARFGARSGTPASRPVLAARAVVTGGAIFVAGLVAVGVAVTLGLAILTGKGVNLQPLSPVTGARIVIGLAAVLALCGVLAYGLGVLLRRGWAAILLALALVALPYAVAALPLLPDTVARWLLRLTPAAGFAVQQTAVEYPQVTAHYAPSAGYYPLPGWAGFAVLCAYTLAVLWSATKRTPADPPANWR
ncbi:hypothetical protein ACQP2T_34950 [Nonomuraea sp. CA-143628]|uniref:hypothetical protein n=1 Tax=Nonomuraea sp. CA-143628 TaxID=3239997 RepID=UPI003D917B3E